MKDTLGSMKATRFCITVIGSPAVGKTALTVQFLTGRFIGEYYTGSDMTYRHSVPYLGGSFNTNVDILDISRTNDELDELVPCSEKTGAFLVVYSLTSAQSFERAKEILAQLPPQAPKYLVANQLDLQHRRQVKKEDGQNLADRYACAFNECSAAETSKDSAHNVKIAFQKLIRQLMSHAYVLPCPRIRFSSFSKLLTSFVSKTRSSSSTAARLERGLSSSSTSSKRSIASRCNSNDSNSTSESSLSVNETQASPVQSPAKCSLPIPIAFRKDSYSKTQATSI